MTYKEMVEKIFEETPADYIIDSYRGSDFVEFVISAGGDIITYRMYDTGLLTER